LTHFFVDAILFPGEWQKDWRIPGAIRQAHHRLRAEPLRSLHIHEYAVKRRTGTRPWTYYRSATSQQFIKWYCRSACSQAFKRL